MAGYELATAYVSLAVETSEIARQIGKGFAAGDKIAAASGRSMGKAMSDAFAKEKGPDLDRLASDAERADARMKASAEQTARKRADAARQVEIAEQRVLETRDKSIAKDRDVQAAEKALAAARKQADADEIAAAEERLARARAAAQPTSADMAAEDRLAKAKRAYIDVSRDGVEMLSRFSKEQDQANAKLAEAKRAADQAETAVDHAGGAFSRLGDKIKSGFSAAFKSPFKGVEDDADRSARQVEREFDEAGDRSGRGFGGGFSDSLKTSLVGIAASVGTYFGIDKIFDFTNAAGDLEQSVGAVDAVFKGSADQMHKWADTASTSVGISENQYNEFASVLGASLKNAGMPMDQLAGKTNDLITMGADLASLYGGSTSDAVDALSAALRGEMDPIERYGISLNDAALTAKGLELGIRKTNGAFTTQQKQTIILALLQDQATDAMGNFNRESDTYAHKQQVMTAKWEDMKTVLGGMIMPLLGDLFSWVSDKGLPMLQGFASGVGEVVDAFKGFAGFTVDNWQWLTPLAVGIAGLGVAAYVASPAFGALAISIKGVFLAIATGVKSIPVIGWVIAGIGLLVSALTLFFTKTETGRDLWAKIWGGIKAVTATVIDWFQTRALPVLSAVWDAISTGAAWVYEDGVKPAFDGIKAVVGGVVGFFQDHIIPAYQAVWDVLSGKDSGALGKSPLADYVNLLRTTAQGLIGWVTGTLVPSFQSVWNILTKGEYTGGLSGKDSGIVSYLFTVRDVALSVVGWFQDTLLPAIQTVWGILVHGDDAGGLGADNSPIVTMLFTVRDAALSVFGWLQSTAIPAVSTAFQVLGGVAIWLWTNVLSVVFDAIKIAAQVLWAVLDAAFGAIAWTFTNVIAPAATWLWQNIIVPVFNGIATAITVAIGIVSGVIQGLVWLWQNILAPVAMWLWTNIIQPAFAGIQLEITLAIAVVTGVIQGLVWLWQNVLAPVVMWLWTNVIVPAWQGIQIAISAVVGWLTGTAWPLIQTVIGYIQVGFGVLRDAIGAAWSWIQNAIIGPVVGWLVGTAWPLISAFLESAKLGFNIMRDSLSAAWNWIHNNIIAPVVSWLTGTAWPMVSSFIENVKAGFNIMKDAVNTAWSWVKNTAIAPVVSWFENTVKPTIDRVTGGIKSAFDTMKDGVSKAWDGVKNAASGPVDFVVNKVVNDGLITNFNKVADTFHVGHIPSVHFAGFARGGILPGYSRESQGDDQLIMARRGEGMMVSEGLRDAASRSLFLAANEAARRGTPFAQFVTGGFAKGGVVGAGLGKKLRDTGADAFEWAKDKGGDAVGAAKNLGGKIVKTATNVGGEVVGAAKNVGGKLVTGADFVTNVVTDPKGMLSALAESLIGAVPGGGLIRDLAVAVPRKIAEVMGNALSSAFAPVDGGGTTSMGAIPEGPRSAALAVAQRFLGKPYVWGAASPTGMDCSGLVLQAYKEAFGISLPHKADTQYAMSHHVSQAGAVPGDIVHWPHHIGLYMGGGRVLHASHSQMRVITSGLWGSPGFGHFASGGIVGDHTLYDTGGVLRPGVTQVLNKTGRPEAILTQPQWRDVSKAVSYVTDASSRSGDVFNVHVEGSPDEDWTTRGRRLVEAAQMARLVGVK